MTSLRDQVKKLGLLGGNRRISQSFMKLMVVMVTVSYVSVISNYLSHGAKYLFANMRITGCYLLSSAPKMLKLNAIRRTPFRLPSNAIDQA